VSKHVLILGAGFGGLELATRLSETMSDAVRVTLIDRNDAFYFGFSKLEVMLGRQSADDIKLHYRDFEKDGVRFRQETVTGVDPAARRVTTDAGSYDADFVVVALGADYDFAATPGFEQGGHDYYSLAGAERLRDALADFKGGKVLVSVLGQPFKCPPAPFEGSFLLHEHFTEKGIRDAVEMATTFPMSRPVPVTGEVAQMFRDGLAARNVKELPEHRVTSIDPATRTARLATGHPPRSQTRASWSTTGCPSTSPTSGPGSRASMRSATSVRARGPFPRPGSLPRRPRASSPPTSPQ
jgi:sulfide:quinone oxidoreductase